MALAVHYSALRPGPHRARPVCRLGAAAAAGALAEPDRYLRFMIVIDARSPVPPFEQVRFQLAQQIHDGTLIVGTRLPTIRRLAADLGLAINTVARAYREL